MSGTIAKPAAPISCVASYIQEKHALIAEIERDMAITYRTFTHDLIEPLREDGDDYGVAHMGMASNVIRTPDKFKMHIEPERLTVLMERHKRFAWYPVALIPLNAQFDEQEGLDDAGYDYNIEVVTFVPEALWQAIADSVLMPVTSEVRVSIHHVDTTRVEASIPDLSLLDIEDLRRFKLAFDREWAEPKFYAQMTYNDLFVEPD